MLTLISVSQHQHWSSEEPTVLPLLLVGSERKFISPLSMTTSAVRHKFLTTNSINVSGLEYGCLWFPRVPYSVWGSNTTETLSGAALACYSLCGEKILRIQTWRFCSAWVINKTAPCGKRGVTYQSLYKSITQAWTNRCSCLQLRLPWLSRLPDFNQTLIIQRLDK